MTSIVTSVIGATTNLKELRQLLESAGLRVEKVYGAGFPFFNLYQMLVKMRGKRLVKDATGRGSLMVRAGSMLFNALFRLNLMFWGWQTIAVAYYDHRAATQASR